MPAAAILFTLLYGVLFLWMTGGFLMGKIKIFSCYGWLWLLVIMRLAALSLDLVASYTAAKLGYRIAFNILFIESYCFLTVCLYDFLSNYRNKTAGAGSRRIFTGIAYFFLTLIALLLLASAVMNATANAKVVQNPSAVLSASNVINSVSMFLLLFFTVFWIGPLIRTAHQDGKRGVKGMNGTLVLLLLAWICLMLRVIYAVGVVLYSVSGHNKNLKNGLNNGWLWMSLSMDFLATAFMAATYFPSRYVARAAVVPAAYNPYGYPGAAATFSAPVQSVDSLEKVPVIQRTV